MFIKIDIGGSGEQINIEVSVTGCECRAEDYVMELVRFTNNFKAEADSRAPNTTLKAKPCGCKEALQNAE
jgi:hypothetical protein